MNLALALSIVLAASGGASPGAVNIAGWVVGLGGLALTVGWLAYLYR